VYIEIIDFCEVTDKNKLTLFLMAHSVYSTGRPSRWASAHILVVCVVLQAAANLVVDAVQIWTV